MASEKISAVDAPRFPVEVVYREEIGAARHPGEAFQFIADVIAEGPPVRDGHYEFTFEGSVYRVTVEPVVTGS